MSKVFNFLWYKVLSTQISHSQVKNCDRQLETKKKYQCYIRKKSKNAYKKRKNENFEKQKNAFFLMSQGSFNPKIRFLGQKVCHVARVQPDTHTHESDYCGHPFKVSGVFLQPIIKDRPNNCMHIFNEHVWGIFAGQLSLLCSDQGAREGLERQGSITLKTIVRGDKLTVTSMTCQLGSEEQGSWPVHVGSPTACPRGTGVRNRAVETGLYIPVSLLGPALVTYLTSCGSAVSRTIKGAAGLPRIGSLGPSGQPRGATSAPAYVVNWKQKFRVLSWT